MKIVNILFVTTTLYLVSSCLKEKTKIFDPTACATIVSYSVDIKPIINTKCVTGSGPGCHDAWIHDYNNIPGYMTAGLWQKAVLEDRTMPEIPNAFSIDSLTQDELIMMKCWINQGYPNN